MLESLKDAQDEFGREAERGDKTGRKSEGTCFDLDRE